MDNDDSVSIYFTDEIQKYFQKQNYLALDFVDGYTLHISPELRLGKRKHLYNPFISLIEKNENFKTVCSKGHTQWKKEPKLLRIENKRIWMSIIHSENKVNEFEGYGNVNASQVLENFAFSELLKNEILSHLKPQKNWIFTSFKNWLKTLWTVFSKDLKRKFY